MITSLAGRLTPMARVVVATRTARLPQHGRQMKILRIICIDSKKHCVLLCYASTRVNTVTSRAGATC